MQRHMTLLALSLLTPACSQPIDGDLETAAAPAALVRPAAKRMLFDLVVGGNTGFLDATGRHHVEEKGSGIRTPTELDAPEGLKVLRFEGGWLEVTNALPESAADFELAPDENVTLSFYFKLTGNSALADKEFFKDRMHAIGFGGDVTNFDIDFGDHDSLTEDRDNTTALWTFWNGGGVPYIADPHKDPRFYYEPSGLWHQYEFERRGPMVFVRVDGQEIGSREESNPIGSALPGMPNWIGRESLAVGKIMSQIIGAYPDASFPFGGSIAGLRLYTTDEVTEPQDTPPVAVWPTECEPNRVHWSHGDLKLAIDPANSTLDPNLTFQRIQGAIAQYAAASSFFNFTFVDATANPDILVAFGGSEVSTVLGVPNDNVMGTTLRTYTLPELKTAKSYLDDAETWTEKRVTMLALHELGHALGLQHCDKAGSVMNGTTASAETLDATTLQALHSLYPQ